MAMTMNRMRWLWNCQKLQSQKSQSRTRVAVVSSAPSSYRMLLLSSLALLLVVVGSATVVDKSCADVCSGDSGSDGFPNDSEEERCVGCCFYEHPEEDTLTARNWYDTNENNERHQWMFARQPMQPIVGEDTIMYVPHYCMNQVQHWKMSY